MTLEKADILNLIKNRIANMGLAKAGSVLK